MNVAQERPRTWSPHIILFSIVLHVVVIYYIASAFNIVPKILPTPSDPPTIEAVRFDPPPPKPLEPERIVKEPRTVPRQPKAPPIEPTVAPLPIPAQTPRESTANADVVAVDREIQEQPTSFTRPKYPSVAEARQVEGRVVLSITIMPDGSVRDVTVVSAQPRGYFEDSALSSVRTWRYAPSGRIRTNVLVHIDYVLRG